MSEERIFAIDPGKDKLGIALLDEEGNILYKKIVTKNSLPEVFSLALSDKKNFTIVVGNSTGREFVVDFLREREIPYRLVNERGSSEEAKILYFKENPPRGIKKFFPASFLFPKEPFDDWQAVVIGRRFLRLKQTEERE